MTAQAGYAMKNKMLLVAWWEFSERAKTKSILLGIILTPVIMASFSILPSLLMMKTDDEAKRYAVLDGTGIVFDSLRARLNAQFKLKDGSPNYLLDKLTGTDLISVKKHADVEILSKTIEAAIILPPTALDSMDVEYRGLNVSNVRDIGRFEKIIGNIISEFKLSKEGLNPTLIRLLTKDISIRTVRVSESGEKESGFLEQFGLSYFFMIMMLIMIIQSGQFLVRSLVEEKSNRLVEVLISSCSPTQLMAGKIIGLSALGLTQLIVWSGIVVVMLIVNHVTSLPLEHLWLMLMYFFLGYLLYSGIFVAFGTLVSTEQEAQQITGYLTILLVIPIALAFFATQSPNSPIIRVLSFIPFITPTMMVLRIPILLPPLWEILGTLVLLALSVWFVIFAAGKIFRVGILITGKRPSLDEIVRWIWT